MFWLRPDRAEPDQEDHDAEHVDRLAAVEVGELAPERDADGAGEQVDGDGPDVVVVAAELRDDRGQGRTDDGLVQGTQEQAEHHREEDLHLRAVAQAEGRVVFEARDVLLAGVGRECFHGWVQFLPCGSCAVVGASVARERGGEGAAQVREGGREPGQLAGVELVEDPIEDPLATGLRPR